MPGTEERIGLVPEARVGGARLVGEKRRRRPRDGTKVHQRPAGRANGAKGDEHVPEGRGLDGSRNDRDARRVGGLLRQQAILRASSDEMNRFRAGAAELTRPSDRPPVGQRQRIGDRAQDGCALSRIDARGLTIT